ncbi:MAG: hypothetical protein HY886_06260 [Deltaproteobacteria bacterium]|nr:hypothetical protein [Deltaproteobacteria bacterium]
MVKIRTYARIINAGKKNFLKPPLLHLKKRNKRELKNKIRLKISLRRLIDLHELGYEPASKKLNKLAAENSTAKIISNEVKKRLKAQIMIRKGMYAKCKWPPVGKSVQGGSPGLKKRK